MSAMLGKRQNTKGDAAGVDCVEVTSSTDTLSLWSANDPKRTYQHRVWRVPPSTHLLDLPWQPEESIQRIPMTFGGSVDSRKRRLGGRMTPAFAIVSLMSGEATKSLAFSCRRYRTR